MFIASTKPTGASVSRSSRSPIRLFRVVVTSRSPLIVPLNRPRLLLVNFATSPSALESPVEAAWMSSRWAFRVAVTRASESTRRRTVLSLACSVRVSFPVWSTVCW